MIALIFVIAVVVATIALGVVATKGSKTAGDFFVAGRSVSVFWNASAISGEYLSAASFMGVAGLVMKNGYDALWYPVGYAAGYLFLLLFIAGPLRRFGACTIPDYAQGRFNSPTFRRIAVLFVLCIGFFYTMPQMKGAGTTMSAILNWPYWVGIVVVGTVITFNVAIGGMKGITLVQAFQYWMKVFAISVPLFVMMSVFGSYGGNLSSTAAEGDSSPSFNRDAKVKISGTAPANVITTPSNGGVDMTFPNGAQITKVTSAVKLPDGAVMPRFLRDEKGHPMEVASYANGLTIPPGGRISVGPRRVDGKASGAKLEFAKDAEVVFSENSKAPNSPTNKKWIEPYGAMTTKYGHPLLYTYSLIIALVCGTAGLPHILVRFYTNPDGKSAKRTTLWVMVMLGAFYVFTPIWGVLGRVGVPELYAGKTDSAVIKLPTLVGNELFGQILSGITSAGAFAAFMSTFSGLLVSMSGAFAHDIYGRMLRPDSTPESRMKAFKVAAVVVGAVSMALGLLVEQWDIATMVGWAFAIGAASYFPLLLIGSWWRGLTKYGAAAGMLLGGLASLTAIVCSMLLDKKYLTFTVDPLVRSLMEQPAIWGVPLSVITMIVVSKLTASNIPEDVDLKMLRLHAPEELGHSVDYID